MAATPERKAATPPRREAQIAARSKRPMPKRPGVYIYFGGESAERGRKVLDLTEEKVVPRRSTPPPGPDENENGRTTHTPAPGDPKAVHVEKLLAATAAKPVENNDLPTYQTTVGRNTPAVEKQLLTDEKMAHDTHSFAPPPLPSAIAGEQTATEVRHGNVVPITVAKDRKLHREKSSITPTKAGWELDLCLKEALVIG